MASACVRFLWVSCTAFGGPVVPLENNMHPTSSTVMPKFEMSGTPAALCDVARDLNVTQPGWSVVETMTCTMIHTRIKMKNFVFIESFFLSQISKNKISQSQIIENKKSQSQISRNKKKTISNLKKKLSRPHSCHLSWETMKKYGISKCFPDCSLCDEELWNLTKIIQESGKRC